MKNNKQPIKERIKNGEFLIGTWCILPSEHVVNVLAKAGLDFVLIDMEHGSADFQCASRMVMAAEVEGCEAIIRVSSNSEAEILKALDIGASGVIVPHIETVMDREKAISYIKYPPKGIRGFSPYARAGGYSNKKDYTSIENDRVMSGIIVEGLDGIENIDKIIDDPELDIVYLGAYDLSVALGIPGDVRNEKIVKIIEDCAKKIIAKGKVAAGLFNTEEDLIFFKKAGVNLACYGVDTSVLYKAFNEMARKV